MTHISKEQTVQYILTMVDDMLQVSLINLFHVDKWVSYFSAGIFLPAPPFYAV